MATNIYFGNHWSRRVVWTRAYQFHVNVVYCCKWVQAADSLQSLSYAKLHNAILCSNPFPKQSYHTNDTYWKVSSVVLNLFSTMPPSSDCSLNKAPLIEMNKLDWTFPHSKTFHVVEREGLVPPWNFINSVMGDHAHRLRVYIIWLRTHNTYNQHLLPQALLWDKLQVYAKCMGIKRAWPPYGFWNLTIRLFLSFVWAKWNFTTFATAREWILPMSIVIGLTMQQTFL